MIAVRRTSARSAAKVEDLAEPGVELAIGAESVPVGAYTRDVLAGCRTASQKKILANVRSEEPDVKGVVGKLTQGAADAGFVYVTDVTDGLTGDRAAAGPAADRRLRRRRGGGRRAARARAAVPRRPHRRARAPTRCARTGFGPPPPDEVVPGALAVALALALAFLTLPVLAIFLDSPPGRADRRARRAGRARRAVAEPADERRRRWRSSSWSARPPRTCWPRGRFRGRALIITLIELPLVLPPAVAGIALLAAVGPSGILGGASRTPASSSRSRRPAWSSRSPSSPSPYYLRQAQAAFGALDRSWLEASRTLGASQARTFARVAIPTASPGWLTGGALAFGRALGEFGATLMFAGSLAGITQTAPLAIYERFATDFEAALALSAVLVAVSAAILLSVKLSAEGRAGDAARRG